MDKKQGDVCITLRKDRSRWEIILDILNTIQEENKVKKTRIMQRVYLDWRNFEKYLDFLLTEGFIAKCNPDPHYKLTDKGKELLKRLKEVDKMLV